MVNKKEEVQKGFLPYYSNRYFRKIYCSQPGKITWKDWSLYAQGYFVLKFQCGD